MSGSVQIRAPLLARCAHEVVVARALAAARVDQRAMAVVARLPRVRAVAVPAALLHRGELFEGGMRVAGTGRLALENHALHDMRDDRALKGAEAAKLRERDDGVRQAPEVFLQQARHVSGDFCRQPFVR